MTSLPGQLYRRIIKYQNIEKKNIMLAQSFSIPLSLSLSLRPERVRNIKVGLEQKKRISILVAFVFYLKF